jgi:hypothetical protein
MERFDGEVIRQSHTSSLGLRKGVFSHCGPTGDLTCVQPQPDVELECIAEQQKEPDRPQT